MKTFYKIMTLVAVASLVLVSCAKKEVPYEKGTADLANCYGVFFPPQEASGNHELDPAEPTEITFDVSRSVSTGDITVPVVLISDTPELFTVEPLVFADGQTESTVTVSFPKAEMGTPYSFSLSIEDPQYALIYGEGATGISTSFTRVKWNNLGTGKWREEFFSGVMGSYVSPANPVWDVTIYERDDKPGMFRLYGVYNEEHIIGWLGDAYKEYHDGVDDDLVIVLDATNPKKVWFPYICIGWQFYSNGPFYFGSLVEENLSACPDMSGYTSSANYGTYENGIVTFPARGMAYGFSADEWWGRANPDAMFYLALPGATPVDYSLKLSSSLTNAGVTPISVTTGMDVTYIKYAVYEGKLTAKEVAAKAAEIVAAEEGEGEGEGPAVAIFDELTPNEVGSAKLGTLGVKGGETGVYTIVAVSFDKEDGDHDIASTDFTFVSAEEPVPVVINCGLELTGKYAPQGYTTENSLEFFVYGKEIVDAKIGVFKYIDIVSKGQAAIVASLKSGKSLTADQIAAINDKGYVDLATGLVPGTEYYLLVWASNGYEDTVVSSTGVSTEGDPLPIYQDYSVENYYEDGEFASRDDVIGTWNYYGTDAYGTLGMREYLGKLSFTASETATEGPDDYGLFDEYVYADGLFGDLSWLANYGMNTKATVEMDVYAGIIYSFQDATVEGDYKVYAGAKALNDWGYNATYCAAFFPVADGYYAYIDVSKYATSYNFCGIGLADPEAGWIANIWDPLMVDPEKDNNGIVSASSIKSTKKLMSDVVAAHKENFVETEKGRIHSIIDEFKASARNHFIPAGLENVERTIKRASLKVESMPWTEPVVAPMGAPGSFPVVLK